MRVAQRLQGRSWTDIRILIEVMLLLVVTRVALWILPFRIVQMLARRLSLQTKVPPSDAEARKQRIVWAARALGRRILGDMPCLTQALVVQVWLKRLGYACTLHIGVAFGTQGRFLAHAWVEQGGKVLIGGKGAPRQYSSLYTLT